MTTPYRLFFHFKQARLDAENDDGYTYNEAEEWTTTHSTELRVRHQQGGSGDLFRDSWNILRGRREDGYEQLSGADTWMKVFVYTQIAPPTYNTVPIDWIKFVVGTSDDPTASDDEPDLDVLSGRYYKAGTEWEDYPPAFYWSYAGYTAQLYVATDFPWNGRLVIPAWDNVIDNFIAPLQSDEGLKNGIIIKEYSHHTDFVEAHGEGFSFDIKVERIEAHYLNPTTNSFSRYQVPEAGGVPVVLTGLGYDNPDAEIEEGGHARPGGWDDRVDNIYIETPDGTVVDNLSRLAGDFSVDSNSQITISSFPALAKGIYQLRLYKSEGGMDIEGYAGDWRTASSGRMRQGARLYIVVGGSKKSVIYSKWRWKKGDDYVFKYYAPIDVRSTLVFYEGKILSASPFTRGVNETTGIPVFSDISVILDNTDREFSKLLAEYVCKNQIVEFYFGYQQTAEVLKEAIFRGYVYDHTKPSSVFEVRLRNVLEKHFSTRLPKYFALESEYPNIHKNHIGREIPEVLGNARLITTEQKGAVEAVYVDTSNFEYLLSRGSLHAVTEVYSNGALIDPADYVINYKDGGRTYVEFDSDQEENKITFNAEGYMYNEWDDPSSAGGYVRNPIYIILFLLAFFAEVPETDVNIESFDELATLYDDLGYGDAGYFILQDEKDASSCLAELLYTYGVKLWINADGQIEIGKKLISDLTAQTLLYTQIDLVGEADKPMGFDEAVNYAKASYGYYPTANLHVGSAEARRQSSINFFEKEISPKSPWQFNWTDSAELVAMRIEEELLKLGFGDQKISFEISVEHFGELDVLDTFMLQDPFAISLTGLGEEGRYYYVEELSFDMMRGTIKISGIDLQWLVRQYLMLGDENLLALNWNVASETDRTYAYLADEVTEAFEDSEPAKILIDENLL